MVDHIIENAAYHEGGHVVIAYQLDWWTLYVEIEGVGAGARDYTALRLLVRDDTIFCRVMVNCAGWLAGWKHDNLAEQIREDEYLKELLEFDIDDECEDGDDLDSLRFIKQENPSWSDNQIIAEFRSHESRCRELLDQPDVWDQVKIIAQTLLRKGKIHQEEIENLLEL